MKIHLTAIGGTGMGAVAGLLAEAGEEVRGSDGVLYPPMSTLLEELRIPVFEGYAAENLDWDPDLVVLGNTCKKDHVEYVEAQARSLKVVSFPEMLAQRFLQDRHGIVIAGTHGKTTTSSLMAHVLLCNGEDPGFLIGGVPLDADRFGGRGFSVGKGKYFVVEGDEYDCACFDKRPKFVHYPCQTAILTGVEFDHADIYATMADVETAFAMLVESMPKDGRLLVWAGSEPALRLAEKAECTVETYAVNASDAGAKGLAAHWQGTYTDLGDGNHQLNLSMRGNELGQCRVPMVGAHNMANATGVAAAALGLGLTFPDLAEGLESFGGVRRRQEVRGVAGGITVIDDFAHHPTAIRETLLALRGVHGSGRLVAVFEPRSSTSRRNVFQKQFADALGVADIVVLPPLFSPEKVPADERLDLLLLLSNLRDRGTDAQGLDNVEEIVTHLKNVTRDGDTVVVMSSGGFDGLPERLVAALR